ncbi:HDOD domain-containing protein [Marinobacter sp. X15-166B]|uniref:HDOD domain-containing protein n=1 Tax=Marinobacter sp. X15-166B TaxID=1897620 RepID=UPI00085CD29C|nr:HDOD domain-containing protein [Marinobacter sp. X15-166B]OEY66722.1 cyclic nucleotide-binding protein [Marinobacter sp. X15-166B]
MAGQEPLTLSRLKQYQPLNRLTDDQLILVASRAEKRVHAPGHKIMERGTRDGLDFFLLAGAVELESADGRTLQIDARSDKARNVLARLQPRMYDVTAIEACEFLVISQDALSQMLRAAPVSHSQEHEPVEFDGNGDGASQVLMNFYTQLRANRLELPSVPEVAWKIRRMADQEEATVAQLARAVTADPAIAAKLVRAGNSPLYRGGADVTNVREAVMRLGTRATRQLVTVYSMREVFRSRQPQLQQAMQRLWQHSREVAAVSWVLADQVTGVDPEEALLAGLLHDIGAVPVLVHAEQHMKLFRDDASLQQAVADLRADIGVVVLEHWGFAERFITALRHAENWGYEDRAPSPQLVDVVIVAQLHVLIGANLNRDLPAFADVPAYRRLGELELNASRSLKMLTRARARVKEIQELLSIG